jgi:hypothetical protein
MIIEKYGERVNAEKDPISAVKLALRASAGCGSKRNAWAYADDAVAAARFHSEAFAAELSGALEDTPTNFPNIDGAVAVLDRYDHDTTT